LELRVPELDPRIEYRPEVSNYGSITKFVISSS